jgi:hypothetical protein
MHLKSVLLTLFSSAFFSSAFAIYVEPNCLDYSPYANLSPAAVDFERDISPLLKDAKSKEDFFDKISKHDKGKTLLEQFTPVHSSESNHKLAATAESPRMISYAGRMMMAATDNPNAAHPGVDDQVEFMEYDPKEKKYDFYLASFNQIPPTLEKNPTDCIQCHDGHPLWESYVVWPGTFRSRGQYLAYLKSQNKSLQGIYTKYNYSDENYPSPLGGSAEQFGDFVADLFYSELAERILQKDFDKLKYAIMAAMMACPNARDFYEHDAKSEELVKKIIAFENKSLKDNEIVREAANTLRLKDDGELKHGETISPDYLDAPQWTILSEILKDRGFSPGNFSRSHFTSRVGYSYLGVGGGGANALMCYLFQDTIKDDPRLGFLKKYFPSSGDISTLKFNDYFQRDPIRKASMDADQELALQTVAKDGAGLAAQRDLDCAELAKAAKIPYVPKDAKPKNSPTHI